MALAPTAEGPYSTKLAQECAGNIGARADWPLGLGRVRRDRFAEPARQFVEAARTIAPSVSIIELEPGGQVELGSAYCDAAPVTSS